MTSRRALLTVVLGLCSSSQVSSYDGNWWRVTPKQERAGFLAGYIDCDLYDAKHDRMARVAWNVLEPKITEYYRLNGSEQGTLVSSLLVRLASRARQGANGGEQHLEAHGIFDGEYWRQSEPGHRLGFVEGYLECLRTETQVAPRVAHGADWFVDRISEWYELMHDDEANPRKTPEKIANVIGRLLRHEKE